MKLCKACLQENSFGYGFHSFTSFKVIFCTVDRNGKHHSFDDKPALIREESSDFINDGESSTTKIWFKHGSIHREFGPAFVTGTEVRQKWKSWFFDGEKAHLIQYQDLYSTKIIKVEGITSIVIKQVKGAFWEFLQGDKKKLVYVLDKD